MKTVYFVRHGESESNASGLMSGSGNDVRLTTKGRDQAQKVGAELKDKNIQLLVCSPMIRTIETATIIANTMNHDPAKIITSPLLIERTYGIYDGRPKAIFDDDYTNDNVHDSVETTEQMYNRFKKALEWIKSLDADTIAIVSHSGASRAIRVIDQKLHHSHMYKLEVLSNAEIYKFSL